MDEKTRRELELDALENIAVELTRLRVLKEHELGVRLEESAESEPYVPSPYVPAVEKYEVLGRGILRGVPASTIGG